METPKSIRTSLIPGEWVSSIDLSDAYLHTPTHPNSRKYLRFCYKSQVFQFTSLPFGLATAPQVFTMIDNVKSLGFYSRLFLVPKPHQRWRPVIDLSRLNTFLHVEKFKMETPESIRTSLVPGEWVLSIDLSDAYLHIPIHPNSRKYQRFCYKAQVFQFTSLPFGLATAPQVFTMIVKEVKLMAL